MIAIDKQLRKQETPKRPSDELQWGVQGGNMASVRTPTDSSGRRITKRYNFEEFASNILDTMDDPNREPLQI